MEFAANARPLDRCPPASAPWRGWLLVVLAVGCCHDARATVGDVGLRSDCNAIPSSRRLSPALPGAFAVDADAYWLDAGRIRWPGQSPDGRYRLYGSRRGALTQDVAGNVHGADLRVTLEPGSPAARKEETFDFVGPGAELALPAAARTRLAALLKGELVLVREAADGRVEAATRLQLPGALDDRFAAAAERNDFGVQVDRHGATFTLWAPTAQAVSACLYDHAEGPATAVLHLDGNAADGTWHGSAAGARAGGYYTFLVDVFVPGLGVVRNRVTDPYAISLGTDSQRSYIADLDDDALMPAGWRASTAPARVAAPTDMAIYELHVRDFSVNDDSVPPAHRGKYLAFTDSGSRGMAHLRALAEAGLTDIHLLPVFDLASVPEVGCVTPTIHASGDSEQAQATIAAVAGKDCFNWGYDPLHYSAPEGSYASDADDGAARVREFRQMVMALHAAGLRVGMDVVYNHTFASGQDPRSVLDRIVPGYYYRLDARGQVEHSTCCENTATEHRMMAKLMSDSVLRWARDYRIDSFRFDLMGHQPRAVMISLRDRLRAELGHDVPLIGEGWNFGEVADGARFVQASQLSLNGSGIGTFNDRLRDAARGGSAGDTGLAMIRRQGYLNGLGYDPNAEALDHPPTETLAEAADQIRAGLAGSLRDFPLRTADGRVRRLADIDYHGQPTGYASAPDEVVNYVENHDNQTLFDINALKLPLATSTRDRARVQMLGAALVAFSQGIAYFHAGVDTLRSKSLDRNSFDSGDWFNRLDWRYRDNYFGTGAPPARDNGADYALLKPRLADPSLRPTPADIAFARDAFRDLLRLRASTSLFHLRRAADVDARLRFYNTGPTQVPTVLALHLDGRGYPGARFDDVLVLVNVDKLAHSLPLPETRGLPYRLHPVQARPDAADAVTLRSAHFDRRTGRVMVPARTAVVFVTGDDPSIAGTTSPVFR